METRISLKYFVNGCRQASVSFLISDEMIYSRVGHKTYNHNLNGVLQSLMVINLSGVLQRCYIWSSIVLAKRRSPTVLLNLLRTLFKRSLNVNLESRMTQSFFWDATWITMLLLKIRGIVYLFCLSATNYFLNFLTRVWVKNHFPLEYSGLNYRQIII